MKIYKHKDTQTPEFQILLNQARKVWHTKSLETFEAIGDKGCCFMGGGLSFLVVPPKCRNPQKVILVKPPRYAQGEVSEFAGMTDAKTFLESHGFECRADYGRMD